MMKKNKSKIEFCALFIVLYLSWILMDLLSVDAIKNPSINFNYSIVINLTFFLTVIFVNPWMWWLKYRNLRTQRVFRSLHVCMVLLCVFLWTILFWMI